ncbi:alkaline phosphatase family protein [Pseudoalteromonas sp. '520P1 No. 423']|uniref:alkaline phosphatase family protein n=1 Tax=Pseudoalteromonas sp. '520P1 No. 423' TaxID=1690037 RepID=UPI0035287AD6
MKNNYPTADISSFRTWAPIHSQFFKNDLALLTRAHAGGTDETNFNLALDTLKNNDPDFIFLHLDEPDVIAHSQCFGSAYNDSIQKADSKLNVLLDEIQKRQSNGENWLVLVTTDHGRTPISGCHHGNQTCQEKTIFISSNQTLNDEFSNVVTSLPNQSVQK